MSWPTPLPRPRALTPAPPWSQLAGAEVAGACAGRWARALGCSVAFVPRPPLSLPPTPSAWAGWESEGGAAGVVAVAREIVHGAVAALTGARPLRDGAPLSPAEEGVFAYLAGAMLSALPEPVRLVGVHGGDPDWPLPRPSGAQLAWRASVAGASGFVRWWVPATPAPTRVRQRPVGTIPIPVAVVAQARVAPDALPVAGDRIPLSRPLALVAGGQILHPLRPGGGRLWVTREEPKMTPPAADALPVALTVELGALTLTAAEVAALAPGAALPLTVDDPPTVRLVAGDVPVALGALVQSSDGDLAIQLTQILLRPAPS